MRKTILVTGATGNIGIPTLKYLRLLNKEANLVACVHDPEKSASLLSDIENIGIRRLDFEDPSSFKSIEGGDFLFLLRPPQISDAEKFRPLLELAKAKGIQGVVFLSVQGADKQSYIPHAKIEKLIQRIGLPYVFLRPSYFMQNLTTTLREDVREGKIMLPSGKAAFMWTDVVNIAEVAANVLLQFDLYSGKAIEVTGKELLSFGETVDRINSAIGASLKFKSVNLIRFWLHRKSIGTSVAMTAVMIMLHYLPRFQKAPHISNAYTLITGKEPTSLGEFAVRERKLFDK